MRRCLMCSMLLALGCGQGGASDGVPATGAAGTGGTPQVAGAGGTAGTTTSSGGSAPANGGAGVSAQAGDSGSGATVAGGAAAVGGAGGAGGGNGGASGSGGMANPEGVPADYQLFIDESFADAASLSKLRFADPAEWVHQDADGGYVESTGATYTPPHASLHSLAIFGELKFGAFVLDAEVLQTNVSGGHRDFCIAWGMETPSRYYYAHIAEAHDAVSHNIHIVLDADRTAITKQFTPGFDWGMNVWHKLRVTRSAAGDMAVYADGGAMPILTATDTRLGSGYVGFGSFDDKGRVRNVKVWAPSAEKAAAAFFSAK
jgi:hypothetical protein